MTATMTIEELRTKWIAHQITGGDDLHPVRETVQYIHYDAKTGSYIAWAQGPQGDIGGHHIRCGSIEALDRRLHQLSGN